MEKKSWGTYFLPDIGDEVLVAFEQGNIKAPVVIGSLYNGDARPPEVNTTGKNEKKIIKSRSGHTIIIDDTTGEEQITIKDKAGSTIKLQSDGKLHIEAVTDLEFKANGEIKFEAKNVKVKVDGSMDVS